MVDWNPQDEDAAETATPCSTTEGLAWLDGFVVDFSYG